jgi:hypothetical protein
LFQHLDIVILLFIVVVYVLYLQFLISEIKIVKPLIEVISVQIQYQFCSTLLNVQTITK